MNKEVQICILNSLGNHFRFNIYQLLHQIELKKFYLDTKISYWIFNIKNRTIWGLPKSCTWAARIGSNKSWNLALVWLGSYFIEAAWFSRIWHNVFRFNSSFLKLYLKGQIAMELNTEFLNDKISLRGPDFSWNFLCAKLHK